jgi:hypothetical protein
MRYEISGLEGDNYSGFVEHFVSQLNVSHFLKSPASNTRCPGASQRLSAVTESNLLAA